MDKPIIFLGPTMPKDEAASILDAVYLPPAAQGDILTAYEAYHPRFIGLIDGYFECVPAVWHKEILFVMSRGVHVYGSSSMGALRAAELDQFGMIGVGEIFNAYKAGIIEDDDEVAVVHGPEDLGYPKLSEAMVSMRKTFAAALVDKVISTAEYELLLESAKGLHYKRRLYENVFYAALACGMSAGTKNRLENWIVTGRRDLKKEDAQELLAFLKNMTAAPVTPKSIKYKFQNTSMWKKLEAEAGQVKGLS